MNNSILFYLISLALVSKATICESNIVDGPVYVTESENDNVNDIQYLHDPELDGDCTTVTYYLYDISNNKNNSIVIYTDDNSFVCDNSCYPIFDCKNIIDGKLNMYYYTSFNESLKYTYVVDYENCHMSKGEIFLTVMLCVFIGTPTLVLIVAFLCMCLFPQEATTTATITEPEQKVQKSNSENANDNNMVELDLSN